jgi:hypothetical protein
MSIKDEPWFNDPFNWYEQEGYPEIVGIQVSDRMALDFLQALYQIYKLLERNQRDHAIEDAKKLAVLLLAAAFDYAEEAIDELIQQEFADTDIDAAFAEMVKEQND